MSCYCDLLRSENITEYCLTCVIRSDNARVWSKLSTDEKAKAVAYKRIITSDKTPSRLMIEYINFLHDLYEEFNVGVIP